MEISQNFVAFSEYMNFKEQITILDHWSNDLNILKNIMLLYKRFGPIIEDYVDVRNWDLDVILRNVCELNKLVRRIASYGVAWFLPDTKITHSKKKSN